MVWMFTETPSLAKILICPAERFPEILFSEKFKLKVEFGDKLMRPSSPKLTVAELVSEVEITPEEKKVCPLKTRAPFKRTGGFSAFPLLPKTVISPANPLVSFAPSATIEELRKTVNIKLNAVTYRDQAISFFFTN